MSTAAQKIEHDHATQTGLGHASQIVEWYRLFKQAEDEEGPDVVEGETGDKFLNIDGGDYYVGDDAQEYIRERVQEHPLSLQYAADFKPASEWHDPDNRVKPDRFELLLSTGGPACRIIGDMDEHGYPEHKKIRIQRQDWFEPWADIHVSELDDADQDVWDDAVYWYASEFVCGDF